MQIYSQKYISRKSYQKKKRKNLDIDTPAVEINDISEEEKKKITDDLITNSINPYSMERTNDFFSVIFKELQLPFITSKYIKTKEDALMFASAFIYSEEATFNYKVELGRGYEQTDVADISNMVIRRKG